MNEDKIKERIEDKIKRYEIYSSIIREIKKDSLLNESNNINDIANFCDLEMIKLKELLRGGLEI